MSYILLTVTVRRYCFDGKCKLPSTHTLLHGCISVALAAFYSVMVSEAQFAVHEEGADVISS